MAQILEKLSEERVIYPENEEVEFYLSAFLAAGLSIIGFFEGKQNRGWFRNWKMGLTENYSIIWSASAIWRFTKIALT